MVKSSKMILVVGLLWLTYSNAASAGTDVGRTVSADGVEIAFEVHGEGEPAVVLVHGWSNNRSIWDDQVAHLAEDYRVVTLDLAGFGQSGNNREAWTMKAFGSDVVAVIDKLQLDRVVLVGFSMGSAAVIEAAGKMPDRVIGLVIVDQLHDPEQKFPPPVAKHIDSVFMDIIHHPSMEKTAPFFRHNRETSYERFLTMIDGASTVGWRESLAGYLRWRNEECLEALKQIEVPLVAINSAQEPTNEEAFRRYVDSFEAHIIPDAGHVVMWDATEKFNRWLEKSVQEFAGTREK